MQPEHPDPFSEAGQRGLEKLMAIGVLVEAGSRLAAEHARSRAAKAERDQERRRAAEQVAAQARRVAAGQARRLAAAEASQRTRTWASLAGDPDRLRDYFAGLPLHEVARHWRHAADTSFGNDLAGTVVTAAEAELRGRWPALMNGYDAARRDGAAPREAMRHAARNAFSGGARPHGATSHAPGGPLTAANDEIERAIRAYTGTLDPIIRGRWLRGLEERGWSASSLAYVEALLGRADAQRRQAGVAAGTADDSATALDEHHAGLTDAHTLTGRAEDDTADAAAHRAATVPVSHDGPAYDAGRRAWIAPARLVRLSFPVPAAHALRATTPAGPNPTVGPARRRGRTR
jgi:hypothetical protein